MSLLAPVEPVIGRPADKSGQVGPATLVTCWAGSRPSCSATAPSPSSMTGKAPRRENDTVPMPPLRERLAYEALAQHHCKIKHRHPRELFADDATGGERLRAQAAGLSLDYSKNRITEENLGLLCQMAQESAVEQRRDAMFAGEHINVSENRSVLHVALRMPKGTSLVADGVDVVAQEHM